MSFLLKVIGILFYLIEMCFYAAITLTLAWLASLPVDPWNQWDKPAIMLFLLVSLMFLAYRLGAFEPLRRNNRLRVVDGD